jgi:hypothetical protein
MWRKIFFQQPELLAINHPRDTEQQRHDQQVLTRLVGMIHG